MSLQNLNQIRARHVLAFAPRGMIRGQNEGEVIKKIPPVILNSGLLAALAYSMDPKQSGWKAVFDGIASHLASEEIGIVPADKNTADFLLDYLAEENTSSAKLRDATDEAMLWLEFARRLA